MDSTKIYKPAQKAKHNSCAVVSNHLDMAVMLCFFSSLFHVLHSFFHLFQSTIPPQSLGLRAHAADLLCAGALAAAAHRCGQSLTQGTVCARLKGQQYFSHVVPNKIAEFSIAQPGSHTIYRVDC
jgi:hypothetical protein